MKKITLNLEYKLPKESKEEANFLTYSYITTAVQIKYPNGLDGQMRRQWGRINRKLDDALDAKQDVIELEDSDFDFIKKTVVDESVKFPAGLAKYINVLEDELERVGKAE